MKKYLILLIFILGCRKIDYIPPQIDLGVKSNSTVINKVSPIVSNGSSVTVQMTLTESAKYSLQVTDLLDNEIKTFGFVAESSSVEKKLNLSELKNGDYNLILIDIKGSEVRTNFIIKK